MKSFTALLALAAPASASSAGSVRSAAEPAAEPAFAELLGAVANDGKLLASDGASADEFARAVAVSGDTIVVGSPLDDDNGMSGGSVYVYVQPASWAGTHQQAAKLVASDGATEDEFGAAVAGGWAGTVSESARLEAFDPAAFDELGVSIAISGGTVVAGAPYRNTQGSDLAGQPE